MRESRTYGSGRGACHEMHVPTATGVDGPLAASRCQCPLIENQSADKEHRSEHPLHRQLRRCLQLHGFAVERREHRTEGIVHTFRVGLAFDL